jgi:hypothetical protein
MQSVATINERMINDYPERTSTLDAAKRLVDRLLGCWQHDLTRPFTHKGKTYRVCTKCGMTRNFDLKTWRTYGGSYRLTPNLPSAQ